MIEGFRPIPHLLPEETLFSWASRTSSLWGDTDPSTASQLLFGIPHTAIHHDFPCGIAYLSESLGDGLGNDRDIAEQRTLLNFYKKFISEGTLQDGLSSLRGSNVGPLKFRLGILTSRFRSHHPLKACSECLKESREEYGWGYWKMQHQFPGVWFCPEHHCLLEESLYKSTGVKRFHWHLPTEGKFRSVVNGDRALSDCEIDNLKSLSSTVTELVGDERFPKLSSEVLREAYMGELSRRGWLSSGGNLRLKLIAPEYLKYAQTLKNIYEFRSLPDSVEQSEAQIGRIFRPMRTGTHPLQHMLIIDWLFGGFDLFAASLLEVQRGKPKVEMLYEHAEVNSDNSDGVIGKRDKFVHLIRQASCSVRYASDSVGIDPQTGIAWAEKEGRQVKRRPKKITEGIRGMVKKALHSGTEKQGIAEAFDISLPSINRILRSESGLYEKWNAARFQKIQRCHRYEWLKLTKKYGSAGVKIVRAMNPALYGWLYRNDRDWLKSNTPRSELIKLRNSSVNWDRRDLYLKKEIQKAAYELFQEGEKRIYLWQLYQRVPELKAKLEVLEKLPLTRQAISEILVWRVDEDGSLDLSMRS